MLETLCSSMHGWRRRGRLKKRFRHHPRDTVLMMRRCSRQVHTTLLYFNVARKQHSKRQEACGKMIAALTSNRCRAMLMQDTYARIQQTCAVPCFGFASKEAKEANFDHATWKHETICGKSSTNKTSNCQLPSTVNLNVGALMIRIGFWGPLYYNSNKEPPK